jgi:hypothetical protein
MLDGYRAFLNRSCCSHFLSWLLLLLLCRDLVSGNGQALYVVVSDGVVGPADIVVCTPRTWCKFSSMLSDWITTEMVFRIVPSGGGLLGCGCTYGLSISICPRPVRRSGVLSLTGCGGDTLCQDRSFEPSLSRSRGIIAAAPLWPAEPLGVRFFHLWETRRASGRIVGTEAAMMTTYSSIVNQMTNLAVLLVKSVRSPRA